MSTEERRTYRRTRLRLRISRIDGLAIPEGMGDLWTADVSPGGMFLHAPIGESVPVGAAMTFELSIPPGEGYSISAGRIRGSGNVVRTEPLAEPVTGVAIQFTRPLALDF